MSVLYPACMSAAPSTLKQGSLPSALAGATPLSIIAHAASAAARASAACPSEGPPDTNASKTSISLGLSGFRSQSCQAVTLGTRCFNSRNSHGTTASAAVVVAAPAATLQGREPSPGRAFRRRCASRSAGTYIGASKPRTTGPDRTAIAKSLTRSWGAVPPRSTSGPVIHQPRLPFAGDPTSTTATCTLPPRSDNEAPSASGTSVWAYLAVCRFINVSFNFLSDVATPASAAFAADISSLVQTATLALRAFTSCHGMPALDLLGLADHRTKVVRNTATKFEPLCCLSSDTEFSATAPFPKCTTNVDHLERTKPSNRGPFCSFSDLDGRW